jgi:hypothetical protein
MVYSPVEPLLLAAREDPVAKSLTFVESDLADANVQRKLLSLQLLLDSGACAALPPSPSPCTYTHTLGDARVVCVVRPTRWSDEAQRLLVPRVSLRHPLFASVFLADVGTWHVGGEQAKVLPLHLARVT